MSKEPSNPLGTEGKYSYYQASAGNIRRIDQNNNVEIFWLVDKKWRKSIAEAYLVRKDEKISEGKAMEIIANFLSQIS